MKLIGLFSVFMSLALFSSVSIAEQGAQAMRKGAPRGVSEEFFACTDKASGDIVALGICATTEKRAQDVRLNKVYSLLMKKLDPSGKQHLKEAERAWIQFNASSVDVELDVRNTEKTANIDAAINEAYRYAERADTLESYARILGG